MKIEMTPEQIDHLGTLAKEGKLLIVVRDEYDRLRAAAAVVNEAKEVIRSERQTSERLRERVGSLEGERHTLEVENVKLKEQLRPHIEDPGGYLAVGGIVQLAKNAEAERDKLQAFKNWVHAYLDAKGVTVDPESPHKVEGCRIGGRMDEVFGELSTLRQLVADMTPAFEECIAERDQLRAGRENILCQIQSLQRANREKEEDLAKMNKRLLEISQEIGKILPLNVQHRGPIDALRWFAAELTDLRTVMGELATACKQYHEESTRLHSVNMHDPAEYRAYKRMGDALAYYAKLTEAKS